MTPIDTLHRIVETEAKARSVYSEAVSLRESFDDYVKVHIEELKREHKAMADAEIERYRISEKERADGEITRLDEQLRHDLEAAAARYQSEKEMVVEKLFRLAVNIDA